MKLGKKLKKNSVALDIVNFGEEADNTSKLEALLNAVNSDDNSHLVTVPPGPHVLSDILLTSPIVQARRTLLSWRRCCCAPRRRCARARR